MSWSTVLGHYSERVSFSVSGLFAGRERKVREKRIDMDRVLIDLPKLKTVGLVSDCILDGLLKAALPLELTSTD